jgi:hypothetical protein
MLLTTTMTELHVVLFHKASWSLRRVQALVDDGIKQRKVQSSH